jgi:L-malate glycosyltransferase
VKPIRVLNLTSTRYGIGGVERLLLDMSDKFDPEIFEISYCNLFCDKGGEGVFPTELKQRGLDYHQIDGRKVTDIPKMSLAVRGLLQREQFDIVHFHMMKATIVGWLASLGLEIRTVLTKHYTTALIAKHPALMQRMDLKATRSVDRIIAISQFVKDDMVRAGVDAGKIKVVHNGITVDAFEGVREENVGSGKELLIGSVGSLTKRKGHRYLVHAFARISKEFGNARLMIAGEGPELGNLTSQASELGILDRITFTGYTSDVASMLRSLDLYVHPATDEPFGIAVLEAMASGKCVIASSVDGLPEIVEDRTTGMLVRSGDVDGLAEAMRAALTDSELRRRLGSDAKNNVRKRFDISRTVEGYKSVYLNLAAR